MYNFGHDPSLQLDLCAATNIEQFRLSSQGLYTETVCKHCRPLSDCSLRTV